MHDVLHPAHRSRGRQLPRLAKLPRFLKLPQGVVAFLLSYAECNGRCSRIKYKKLSQMSLGALRKSAWTSSQSSSAELRSAGTRGALKSYRRYSLANFYTCCGPTGTQHSVSPANEHAEQGACVTRRCTLGGLASGLTLLSMPANAEDRAAGVCSVLQAHAALDIGAACYHGQAMGASKHVHVCAGAMELERRLEERISEFELPNGLHFIVMERHNAPIVSVHTYADVGAFDERDGQTGAAFLPFQAQTPKVQHTLCHHIACLHVTVVWYRGHDSDCHSTL